VSAALAPGALPQASLVQKLQDAVSWPRVKNLWALLRGVARAPDKVAALRQAFFANSSADYRCPDGTPARDYDTINRGICAGFRYDGSATFTDGKPVEPARGAQLARAAAAPSSKYSRALALTGGVPNEAVLRRLGGLTTAMAQNGGRLVLIMPPLLPGLEQALASSGHAGAAVRATKSAFDQWAGRAGVVIIDAGAAERFGCEPGEFLDEHHAYPDCFRRVFSRFWRGHTAGVIRPGLWPRPGA
jgi:hypothetical protein